MRDAPTCRLATIRSVCAYRCPKDCLPQSTALGSTIDNRARYVLSYLCLHRFSRSVLNGCSNGYRFLISVWACKSLFLHGCEIKAGVGRTGNEASIVE